MLLVKVSENTVVLLPDRLYSSTSLWCIVVDNKLRDPNCVAWNEILLTRLSDPENIEMVKKTWRSIRLAYDHVSPSSAQTVCCGTERRKSRTYIEWSLVTMTVSNPFLALPSYVRMISQHCFALQMRIYPCCLLRLIHYSNKSTKRNSIEAALPSPNAFSR